MIFYPYKAGNTHSKRILETGINVHLPVPDLDHTGMDTMIEISKQPNKK